MFQYKDRNFPVSDKAFFILNKVFFLFCIKCFISWINRLLFILDKVFLSCIKAFYLSWIKRFLFGIKHFFILNKLFLYWIKRFLYWKSIFPFHINHFKCRINIVFIHLRIIRNVQLSNWKRILIFPSEFSVLPRKISAYLRAESPSGANTRKIRGFSKILNINSLYLMVILSHCKKHHFTFRNGPFQGPI